MNKTIQRNFDSIVLALAHDIAPVEICGLRVELGLNCKINRVVAIANCLKQIDGWVSFQVEILH